MKAKKFNLFPFQEEAVTRHLQILDKVGASLDGTGCGGGKTVIASAVAKKYGLKTAVICPKSVLKKWSATLEAFGIEALFVLNPEKLRTGNTPWLKKVHGKGKSTKVNFEWVVPQGTLLIFDEAHVFGAHGSQNGKLLEAARGIPTLMLSATAAESPLKMKAIGAQLRLFSSNGFWSWVREMGAEESHWGGLEWNPRLPENKAKMERLHDSVFTSRGYRVPESVLRDQLPELIVSDEALWLSPEDRKEIKRLYEEMTDTEDPGGVKNLRQRQAIELVKIPYLTERAQEIVASGGSAVVFLNFHASIDSFLDKIPDAGVFDGRRKQAERQETQAAFQRGDLSIVVVQIAAGGQSIDLHDTEGTRPRVALLCPQFSGLTEEQALGRISRVGAKSRAVAIRLYAPGGVEEAALAITTEKRENTKILNEGTAKDVSKSAMIITPQPTAEHAERDHSEHSPSSLKEKAKCSGFRNDQTRDKSAANRGTLGHEAVEKENLDLIPPDDPKLREAAGLCLKYLNVLRSRCVGKVEDIRERRYAMLDQFGHVDHVMLHNEGRYGELVDYKFAFGAYEADGPQFWAYAVGIFNEHPTLERLTVHVALPFQGHIDTVTWERSELDSLTAKVLAIITAARKDDPTTYLTGGHCAWCARRAQCPKLNDLALTIASKYKPEELTIPAQYDPANITDPEVIALAKKVGPIMESWAKKVNERALEMRLQEGIEIPGWELAEKAAPFKVTDAQAAWEVVKDKITPEAFAACAEVKIGELEKAVARTAKRGEMAKAKDALRDALTDANAAKVDGVVYYLKKSK
jgi:superfamily II DNA or RNA helicase